MNRFAFSRPKPAGVLLLLAALGLWAGVLRVLWSEPRIHPAVVVLGLCGMTLGMGWFWRKRHHGWLAAAALAPCLILVALLAASVTNL